MKPKPRPERVPYRRGEHEEIALAALRDLRSEHVPSFSSDNQWLRFAVRLLWELWLLSGKQQLVFQCGVAGERASSVAVDLRGAPDELSSQLGEARLRRSEWLLLEQLRSGLSHASRSAVLRHALSACQKVCVAVSASGDELWVMRGGLLYTLPKLRELAADLTSSDSLALLGEGARAWDAQLRRRVGGTGAVEYLEAGQLWAKLGYDRVDIEVPLDRGEGHVRLVWGRDRALKAELVQASSDASAAHRAVPRSEESRPAASEPGEATQAPLRSTAPRQAPRGIGTATTAPPDTARQPESHATRWLSLGEVAQCAQSR